MLGHQQNLQQHKCGGGRAWIGGKGKGEGSGVTSGRVGGRRGSGIVVMARGKKEEPSTDNRKGGNKKGGKDNNSKDGGRKDQQSGKTSKSEKTGTAVGTSPLPSPGGLPLPALGGGLLVGLFILGKLMGGKGNRG